MRSDASNERWREGGYSAWVHLGNASFKDFTVHFADGRTEKIP